MEQGWDRARAATFAWTSTAFPMLTGTLVTAAGFLPVGFAKSSAGEYAGGIFWIVGLALIASWIVAVLFTPYLGLKLLPDLAKLGVHENPDAIYDTRVYRAMRRVIGWCLRWRKTVVALTVLLFVGSIAAFGLVQQQFFPTSTRSELFFEMRLAEGTAIGVTDASAKRAERLPAGDPDIVTYTSYVGQGSPRRTRTSPRSSSSPRISRPASASRRDWNTRLQTARCRKLARGSIVSCSARRSASPCSFAWLDPIP